jgi:hypothetical protein
MEPILPQLIYAADINDVLTAHSLPPFSTPEFRALLSQRDAMRRELDQLWGRRGLTDEEYRHRRDLAAERKALDARINAVKDEHAALIAASRLGQEPPEYKLTPPEGAEEMGHYPSGSAQWLRTRQHTLGGSDVGSIMHVDEHWGERNFKQVRESKLDLSPQTQEHSGATGRGDTWEPALDNLASEILGVPVYMDKTTYRRGLSHANLDGFTLSKRGTLKSVVECKTSSFPDEWSENHIPEGYVLQVGHYMHFYGSSQACLIVNIDDREIRAYRVTPDTQIHCSPALKRHTGLEWASYLDLYQEAEAYVDKWNKTREANRAALERRPIDGTAA